MICINIILTEKEMSMVEQLAEEQDMNINMVLRLIFQQGMDKIMEERDHE